MKDQTFKEILQELGNIEVTPLLTPIPTNLSEEMDKFFKTPGYNPQFKYSRRDLSMQRKQIDESFEKIDSSLLEETEKKYLLDVAFFIECLIDLNESLGKENLFWENIQRVYNWDLNTTPDFNNLILRKEVSENIYNAITIKQKLEEALNSRNLAWKVEIVGKDRSDVRVSIDKRVVNVGEQAVSNPIKLKKTIVHEIDSHIIRYENALKTGISIIVRGNLPGKILAEEGFAVFNEYKNGVLTTEDLDRYKMRFELCREGGSFREIYTKCIDVYKLSSTKAFETTLRVKRGYGDTNYPYIHKKDSSYLKGLELIIQSVKEVEDYKHLFWGRVPSENEYIFSKLRLEDIDFTYPSWL